MPLVCPSAPRMGTVSLPRIPSPTPITRRFGGSPYTRSPSPGVRSPWLNGSSAMPSMHDNAFVSSPNPAHLPQLLSSFDEALAIEGNVTNALGLIFDTPHTGHQLPTPASPPKALPPLTPQIPFIPLPSPATSASRGYNDMQSGQEGPQPFLATSDNYTGDAQASSSHERGTNNTNPIDTVADARQEEAESLKDINAIATARSCLEDMERMEGEGEAVSFSILMAIIGRLEHKISSKQLSGDDIDILDVIGSFHKS